MTKTQVLKQIADAKRSLTRAQNLTKRLTGLNVGGGVLTSTPRTRPTLAIDDLEQAAAEATKAAEMLREFLGGTR